MVLYDIVEQTIKEEDLLAPGQAVLVAFSGGADSLCLLDCLRKLGYVTCAVHLDHQLRPESGQEAEAAQKLANQLGVAFRIGQESITSEGNSLEESARLVRYQFLCRIAQEEGLSVIAAGHTQDDQAETVLMHLLRGAGSTGLRGMSPKTHLGDLHDLPDCSELTLVRPLLRATKEQTQKHCAEIGLTPVEDASNTDHRFNRNRIRHHLMPVLEDFNPNIRGALARLAQILSAESDFVRAAVDEAMEVTANVEEGVVKLQLAPFRLQPLAVQRGLIRRAADHIDPALRELGFDSTRSALEFILHGSSDALTLPAGLELLRLKEHIVFHRSGVILSFPEYPQLHEQEAILVPMPGELDLAQGWRLQTQILDTTDNLIAQTQSDFLAVFDLDRIDKLTLDCMRTGDRIQLLGMEGSSKVSDVLINLKLPQQARARWPILRDSTGILWVVSLRMSGLYRIRSNTKHALLVKLIPPSQ
jgi:tRNA(Ile)-lysidine synthase